MKMTLISQTTQSLRKKPQKVSPKCHLMALLNKIAESLDAWQAKKRHKSFKNKPQEAYHPKLSTNKKFQTSYPQEPDQCSNYNSSSYIPKNDSCGLTHEDKRRQKLPPQIYIPNQYDHYNQQKDSEDLDKGCKRSRSSDFIFVDPTYSSLVNSTPSCSCANCWQNPNPCGLPRQMRPCQDTKLTSVDYFNQVCLKECSRCHHSNPREPTPKSTFENSRSQNNFKFRTKCLADTKKIQQHRSQEKAQNLKISNWHNLMVSKTKNPKKLKKKKNAALLKAKISKAIPVRKRNKQIKNLVNYIDDPHPGIRKGKLTPYDLSIKKIKRYTPVQDLTKYEVQHMNQRKMGSTSRCLCSSTHSKGSNSSLSSKYWSSQHLKKLRNHYDHRTITEEGTRETCCKDSYLCMGSFEVPNSYERTLIPHDESHKLSLIKNKVEQTLNTYRSYCSNLQQEMAKLKHENMKLRNLMRLS